MSFETLLDAASLGSRYVLLAALYYAVIAYPCLVVLRRRRHK